MRPDKPGVWEWFEEDGTKRLVHVCDVGVPMGEKCLRVAWWGGFYNVHDLVNEPIYDCNMRQVRTISHPAEWPDRWGKYVGPLESVLNDQLYQAPTADQLEEIFKLNRQH
jgi:hypothetical protein